MEKVKITDYEIIDHGIEWSDYFQGCGCSLTDYDSVATGIGDTPLVAIEDALEQLATSENGDIDFSAIETDSDYEKIRASNITVKKWSMENHGLSELEYDAHEETPWYHISIRYNLPQKDTGVYDRK